MGRICGLLCRIPIRFQCNFHKGNILIIPFTLNRNCYNRGFAVAGVDLLINIKIVGIRERNSIADICRNTCFLYILGSDRGCINQFPRNDLH